MFIFLPAAFGPAPGCSSYAWSGHQQFGCARLRDHRSSREAHPGSAVEWRHRGSRRQPHGRAGWWLPRWIRGRRTGVPGTTITQPRQESHDHQEFSPNTIQVHVALKKEGQPLLLRMLVQSVSKLYSLYSLVQFTVVCRADSDSSLLNLMYIVRGGWEHGLWYM